ncbi:MAG: galactose ABC transporter substrate-binding protein [Clostridiaceae bacterium]|nr:galactose ABC transporter substrate-binding protein [Eubacteriales bacterium]
MKKASVRRFLAAALALTLSASLCACDSATERDTVKIGVSVYKGDDTFISAMMESFSAAAAAFEEQTGVRVNISIADANESQATQNEQIERFLSLDYDVLCVNLVDRTDAGAIIDRARDADVPVVFFNREPVQEDMLKWDRILYVGSDARESATLEAGIVIGRCEADPKSIDTNGDGIIQYVMLEGERRHQDAIIRTEVSVETLKLAGFEVEKLDGGIANWSRDQAAALTETYLRAYGDRIELIICNNDDMALGAADAVERLGMDFSNIVGIDGTERGLAAVREGRLLGTVVMDLPAHGRAIFEAAYAFATGADPADTLDVLPDRSVRIPMYIGTCESLEIRDKRERKPSDEPYDFIAFADDFA